MVFGGGALVIGGGNVGGGGGRGAKGPGAGALETGRPGTWCDGRVGGGTRGGILLCVP